MLHLGAGLGALARYVAATRPGSTGDLVDLDPAVARLAAADGLTVEVADALAALRARPRRSFDAVIGDVFDGPRVPRHLTTLDAADAVRRVLRPGGVYAVNLIDDPPHRMARRQVATLCASFAECVLLAERPVLSGRRTGNLVVACADRTLPVAKLAQPLAGRPRRRGDADLVRRREAAARARRLRRAGRASPQALPCPAGARGRAGRPR